MRVPCQPGARGFERQMTRRGLRTQRGEKTTRSTHNEVPSVGHKELAGGICGRQRFGSSAIAVSSGGAARVGQLIEIPGARMRRLRARELSIFKLRLHLEKRGGWQVGAEELSD